MSRIPLPPSPSRRRSSARRHRALWVLLIGGVGAAVAGRGRVKALLGHGSEDDLYAGATVSSTEGPAVAAAQTEVDDIAHEEVPPSVDLAGDAEPAGAEAETTEPPSDDIPEVGVSEEEIDELTAADSRLAGDEATATDESGSALDDLPPVAGDEIDPTLSATDVADPAAVVDPSEAAAVVEPDPEAPADMPDAAPLDAPPLADGAEEDPLAIEEADKPAAEAGAIGSEPEDPDRPR